MAEKKVVKSDVINDIARRNSRIVQLDYLGAKVKEEVDALRKEHLEDLKKINVETGSKSWEVMSESGERLATLGLSFAAEKFEISDLQAALEWAKEAAPALVHVEEVPAVVIEAHSRDVLDESKFLKGLSFKGGKVFLGGVEVPEGVVKHTPKGKTAKAMMISKKDPDAILRALYDPQSAARDFEILPPPAADAEALEAGEESPVMPWDL